MEEDKEKTSIEDVEEARTGAYAEKPFRDVLFEYRENLSVDERRALERIAGEKGEEAMRAYRQTKFLEDPRIDSLRNLAGQTIVLQGGVFGTIGFRTEEGEDVAGKFASSLEELFKRIGLGEVDKVIVDEKIGFPAKQKRITSIGASMNYGAAVVMQSLGGPEHMVEEKQQERGCSRDNLADMLRGYFAAAIITGSSVRGIEALAQIAKLRRREPLEVIQEYVPLLRELREQYPDVVNKRVGGVKALDSALGRYGFLWSPGAGTFVYMGEEVAPGLATPAK